MSNMYTEMQKRHQEEINAFPSFFAFNEMQMAEGLKKLGLNRSSARKELCQGAFGMFYRKSDADNLHAMLRRFITEKANAIASDPTGEGFICDMFRSELADHEFAYTQDISDALAACGFSARQVIEDPRLKHGLEKACTDLMAWYREHN